MRAFLKKLWLKLKKNYWYLILLTISTIYVWYNRFTINQLKELTAQNLIFIIWLVLLLLPLFSEMELLGVKVKKEVDKATADIKESVKNMQMQISQFSSSISNNINFSNTILPPEQKIDELLNIVKGLQQSNPSDATDIIDCQDSNVLLFKVRLSIETKLRELAEKIGYDEKFSVMKIVSLLVRAEILNGITSDLINQVCRIANRGVHGEIVDDKYVEFVKETYPEILRQLNDATSKLKYLVCPRCKYSGYSSFENVCPKCGFISDEG